jgi:ribosome-associated translation inhibitor RaiA
MELPLQITFRNMDPSPTIEAKIKEHSKRLDRYYGRITSCRVVVEAPHRHHNKGKLYRVLIELSVPDGKLVASREPEQRQAHQDAYVAVRDAFEAVRRQLDGYAEKRRGGVKTHESPPHGRIARLVPEKDFGVIETPDGREIYFHRNSLVDSPFEKLEVGAEVRFSEEFGEEGPKATTVHVVGKHHIVT